MSKFQISVIDFITESGKHPIGEKDAQGEDICVGDVVKYNGDKHMIVYRYGSFMLKQPMTMHTLGISDWGEVLRLKEVWSTPDFMICGDTSEPFYEKVKHLLG
jgi:hypothetical protein